MNARGITLVPALAWVGVLSIAGCEGAPTEPAGPPPVAAAPANVTHFVSTGDLFRQDLVGCIGGPEEEVQVTGRWHTVHHMIATPRGTTIVKTRGHAQNARGVGLTTGRMYRYIGSYGTGQTEHSGGLPFSFYYTEVMGFVGQGGTGFTYRQMMRFTVNPQGEFVGNVIKSDFRCGDPG
ncbi:MAG TPA: hypothetical protein VK858_10690 [Longimicrobiales bacterium]|nr:hypothetical protein [Longimicrobiales bacterium]